MIHLIIRAIGSDKWVTVEDLSGPMIKFSGLVEGQPENSQDHGNDVMVEIHSTRTIPGRAVVYAGRRENDRAAKFLCEHLSQSCILALRDGDLEPRGEDSPKFTECRCVRLMQAQEAEDAGSAGDTAGEDALSP